jgi:hypothetical protein
MSRTSLTERIHTRFFLQHGLIIANAADVENLID